MDEFIIRGFFTAAGYLLLLVKHGKRHKIVVREKYDGVYGDAARELLRRTVLVPAMVIWLLLLASFILVFIYVVIFK